jgi:hypothetical protein
VDFFLNDDGRVEMVSRKRSLTELKGMIPPPVHNVTLADMEQAIARGAGGDDRD